MALRGALVDRGRIIRKEVVAVAKVDGRPVFAEPEPEEVPLFRCRLDLPAAPQRPDDSGRRYTRRTPTLLVGVRDQAGNVLEFQQDDDIEVISPQLGTARWKVDGEPKPLRKKRRVIGWELSIGRVEESQAERPVIH